MNRLDPLTLPLHGRRLIEASAGTGKTYAITSIVLRLLLGHDGTATGVNPRRIEQILIVTFTRAATEELRGRIRARLREARLAFEEDAGISEDEFIAQLRLASSDRVVDHRRLALAEMDLDLASIFTIHGFASRMLQRNAFESGASFAADISEDDRRVVEEALRDVWRERVYPLAALPASTVLDESSAREFIDRARQLLGKQGLRFDNLPAASWSELLQELADGEYTLLDWWRAHGSSVRGVMGSTKLNKSGKEAFCASLAALEAGEPTALDRMIVSGLSQSFLESQLNKAAKGNSLPDLDLFRLADRVLDTGRQLSARLLFDALELARTRLAELKERTGLLGYEDLLRLLEKGLAAPGGGERLAAAIREQYPVALIDECQDTDPLQWCVFERIYDAPGTGLFLVGDPKQAIYAFRGADVYAYLRVRREAGESYTLDTNYRSVEPLIRSLNALFGLRKDKDPFRGKGDMPYVEVRPSHRPDAKPLTRDGEPLAPLQLLAHLDDRPIGTGDYRARMARLAAGHMAGLLADVSVRIGERRLEAGDIACLVRGWPDALALASELQRYAIPYVYRGRDSVFGSAAALDVHQLLAAVLDPGSERHLRAALGCALLGYGAAELDSLLGDERALLEVQQRFFVHARRLREHGVQAALRRLLFEHEVPARVLAQPDGERRLTNCLHLLELLQAERETLDSDEALLARLAERIANPDGEREEQQLRLESDARRVQIVTLHSSKGLEYPVVYLPFPAHYRKADEPLWHDRESLHLRYDLEGNEDSLARADEERLAEDMRLLYVGLTRAVHCCVLGVADIVHGSSKKSDLERTAFGYLLGAQEGEARAALERLIALPGAVLFDPEAALPLACTEGRARGACSARVHGRHRARLECHQLFRAGAHGLRTRRARIPPARTGWCRTQSPRRRGPRHFRFRARRGSGELSARLAGAGRFLATGRGARQCRADRHGAGTQRPRSAMAAGTGADDRRCARLHPGRRIAAARGSVGRAAYRRNGIRAAARAARRKRTQPSAAAARTARRTRRRAWLRDDPGHAERLYRPGVRVSRALFRGRLQIEPPRCQRRGLRAANARGLHRRAPLRSAIRALQRGAAALPAGASWRRL
ncbi:MAG: UvrD-helicase domain-containing protein [Gammaproteobacteria bacterium]|nr:UvrD-helicase domain-containing protein [Gammaproteobacteria bacterium]